MNDAKIEIIENDGKKTYYIDVGNMTGEEAMKVIEEVKNERR